MIVPQKKLGLTFLLWFFLTIVNTGKGQEMLGIVNSNYAGIYSISNNPSNMLTSKLYMDYNLLGLQSSFYNNYMYLDAQDALAFLFKRTLPIYYTNEYEERNFKINNSNENKYGFLNTRMEGPGAMIVNHKHAFGFTTSFRTNSWFYDIPPDIATFLYEAIDYDSLQNIRFQHAEDMKLGAVSWTELSFSYAFNFHRYRWNSWNVGISIKPLFGNAGMYTSIDNLDYQVYTDDSASVYNASFSYGLSLPINYNDNSLQISPIFRGAGIATDIGFSYLRTKKGHQNFSYGQLCEAPYEDYNFRIGFSIKDLGFIKFNKKAIAKAYTNTSAEWVKDKGNDVLPSTSINEMVIKIESFFKEDAEDYTDNETFTIYLAPIVNFNIDLPLSYLIYLNGSVYYSFNFGGASVYKPSVIAIAPRYETSRFEISIPISVYEWQFTKPKIGLALRYGNFFIGMNDLSPITGKADLFGIDIYGGVRLNLSNVFKMNYIKGYCGGRNLRNIETFDFRNF